MPSGASAISPSPIRDACSVARIDPSDIEEYDPQWRTKILQLILRKIITGYVVDTYTFIDEQMSDAICRVYFKKPGKAIYFGRLWKTKRFKSFVQNGLDNLYPLRRLRHNTGYSCHLTLASLLYTLPLTGAVPLIQDRQHE